MEPVTIKKPVGYNPTNDRSKNDPDDVRKIHDLLNRIPADKGGAAIYFNPSLGYNPAVTDVHILHFQNRWFTGKNCDAVVSPGGPTLRKMNELTKSEYQNRAFVSPAKVIAIMTSEMRGSVMLKAITRHKERDKDGVMKHRFLGRFKVPLYVLKVGIGKVDNGKPTIDAVKEYTVVRYGVRYEHNKAIAGAPAREWFTLQGPPYGGWVLSRSGYMRGSWLITGQYLIHPGPRSGGRNDRPADELAGGLGCIQPVDGGMSALDRHVREASFSSHFIEGFIDAAEADRQITQAGSFSCFVENAAKPTVTCLDDFTAIGGPPIGPIRLV